MAAGSTNDSQANDGDTDMIMYVQLDFVNNEVRMLQIPRNILVTTDYNVSHNYQINNVAITQGSDGNNGGALATLINEQLGLYIDGCVRPSVWRHWWNWWIPSVPFRSMFRKRSPTPMITAM